MDTLKANSWYTTCSRCGKFTDWIHTCSVIQLQVSLPSWVDLISYIPYNVFLKHLSHFDKRNSNYYMCDLKEFKDLVRSINE